MDKKGPSDHEKDAAFPLDKNNSQDNNSNIDIGAENKAKIEQKLSLENEPENIYSEITLEEEEEEEDIYSNIDTNSIVQTLISSMGGVNNSFRLFKGKELQTSRNMDLGYFNNNEIYSSLYIYSEIIQFIIKPSTLKILYCYAKLDFCHDGLICSLTGYNPCKIHFLRKRLVPFILVKPFKLMKGNGAKIYKAYIMEKNGCGNYSSMEILCMKKEVKHILETIFKDLEKNEPYLASKVADENANFESYKARIMRAEERRQQFFIGECCNCKRNISKLSNYSEYKGKLYCRECYLNI